MMVHNLEIICRHRVRSSQSVGRSVGFPAKETGVGEQINLAWHDIGGVDNNNDDGHVGGGSDEKQRYYWMTRMLKTRTTLKPRRPKPTKAKLVVQSPCFRKEWKFCVQGRAPFGVINFERNQ